MTQIDPGLVALRAELERRGMVVAPHGDHLCVRLPLFVSVRLRREGGALRAIPQIGPLTRGPGFAATLAPLVATGAGILFAGVTGPLVAAACVALGVALAGVSGVVIAEGCLTRVTLLWELMVSGALPSTPRSGARPTELSPPAARQLGEPAPTGEGQRPVRVADETI
jgi:hypothetical protein